MNTAPDEVEFVPLHTLECVGTRQHPGCGASFMSESRRPRFCGDCIRLDRSRSFVFVERRRLHAALHEVAAAAIDEEAHP